MSYGSRRGDLAALVLLTCLQITSPQSPSDWSTGGLSALPACGMYTLSHGRARPAAGQREPVGFTLICDPGYILAGPGEETVQCKPDGRFTEGKTCHPVSCGPLVEPGGVASGSRV